MPNCFQNNYTNSHPISALYESSYFCIFAMLDRLYFMVTVICIAVVTNEINCIFVPCFYFFFLCKMSVYVYLSDLRDSLYTAWRRKMATHSSILAWRIPWTEEQSMGLQRVRCDWATDTFVYYGYICYKYLIKEWERRAYLIKWLWLLFSH